MSSEFGEKKEVQFKKIYQLLSKYKQILVVSLSNVGSRQVQDIRRILGKKGAQLVIAKNTLFKKVLADRTTGIDKDHVYYEDLKGFGAAIKELDIFKNQISGKVGFIFTDEPVFELRPLIEANKVETAARVGVISPIDVVIPPGPTGMDPSQISFFHALQIPTKIEKGQIQITKDFQVCKAGVKVGQSQAVLLQKLGKKPFNYGMEVLACYDSGSIMNKQQVSINLSDILSTFAKCSQNVAAVSLAIGDVNEASVPHLVINAFKNLAAIGFASGYKFDQIKSTGTAAPAAAQQQAAKPVAVVEAPKQEEPEDDVDMGGLFD